MKPVAALLIFVLGGFVLAYSLQLQMYTESGPGAGLFPAGIGIGLCLLSALWFLQTRREAQVAGGVNTRPGMLPGRVGLQLLALVLFVPVFQWFGYMAAAAALTIATALIAGERNWLGIGVVGLITTVGVYYLFAALGTTI